MASYSAYPDEWFLQDQPGVGGLCRRHGIEFAPLTQVTEFDAPIIRSS
jgi:hypothetical protein